MAARPELAHVDALPSTSRLAWMFFMQPIALHRMLVSLGIEPDGSGIALWRADGISRRYLLRLIRAGVLVLVGGVFLAQLMQVFVHASTGDPWPWITAGRIAKVFLGVAVGVVVGVVGSVAGGVAIGVAIGVAGGVAGDLAGGVAFGVAGGVALGVAGGVASGVAGGVASGVAGGVAIGMAGGVALGVAGGVAGGVAIILSIFRLHLYPFEVVGTLLARQFDGVHCTSALRWTPVRHVDLCYLPIPGLEAHILLNAESHPKLVLEVLEACDRSPGLRPMVSRVSARLAAESLTRMAHQRDFAVVMHLSAPWLPTARTAPPAIMDLRAVARYLAAASHASSAHHCIKFLHDARGLLDAATNGLRASPPEYRSVMPATFAVWRRTIDQMLDVAEAQAARGVPNPYLTQPLDPRSGGELFRGRDTIVRELQNILADPTQRNSIALLGPRRCGKSSLLKMLPTLLPDALPVFFDLQDNPAGSPAQLYAAIARRIAEQARSEHQMVLPVFPDHADIVAFASWLEQLDHTLGDRRLLLCIDEFERLPDLFPGDRQALLQFMGLLRATVQNRRNLRVLVAGVAPFDELDAVWSDHLINLRELRVEHLDADSALALLIRPLPDFGAIPEQVARRVIERTGCQPLLLQLYGSMLVDRINAEERSAATDDDFVKVDREVLEGGNAVNHFRNLYDTAPADAQSALRNLAGGIEVTFSTHTRRYLVRRCLITSEGRPRIPVFYDWIKVECV